MLKGDRRQRAMKDRRSGTGDAMQVERSDFEEQAM